MSDPGGFWNLGDIQVKKSVQDTVFPAGLTYDFEDGFGTPVLGASFQLVSNLENNVVAAGGLEPPTPGL